MNADGSLDPDSPPSTPAPAPAPSTATATTASGAWNTPLRSNNWSSTPRVSALAAAARAAAPATPDPVAPAPAAALTPDLSSLRSDRRASLFTTIRNRNAAAEQEKLMEQQNPVPVPRSRAELKQALHAETERAVAQRERRGNSAGNDRSSVYLSSTIIKEKKREDFYLKTDAVAAADDAGAGAGADARPGRESSVVRYNRMGEKIVSHRSQAYFDEVDSRGGSGDFTPDVQTLYNEMRSPMMGPLRPASEQWLTETAQPMRTKYAENMLNFHFFSGTVASRPLMLTYDNVLQSLNNQSSSLLATISTDLLPWLFPSFEGNDNSKDAPPLTPAEVQTILSTPEVLANYLQMQQAVLSCLGFDVDPMYGLVESSRRGLAQGYAALPSADTVMRAMLVSLRDMGFSELAFLIVELAARMSSGRRDLAALRAVSMGAWTQLLPEEYQKRMQLLTKYWTMTDNTHVSWATLFKMRMDQVHRSMMRHKLATTTRKDSAAEGKKISQEGLIAQQNTIASVMAVKRAREKAQLAVAAESKANEAPKNSALRAAAEAAREEAKHATEAARSAATLSVNSTNARVRLDSDKRNAHATYAEAVAKVRGEDHVAARAAMTSMPTGRRADAAVRAQGQQARAFYKQKVAPLLKGT